MEITSYLASPPSRYYLLCSQIQDELLFCHQE